MSERQSLSRNINLCKCCSVLKYMDKTWCLFMKTICALHDEDWEAATREPGGIKKEHAGRKNQRHVRGRGGEEAVFDKEGKVVGNGRIEEIIWLQVKSTIFWVRVRSENLYSNLAECALHIP